MFKFEESVKSHMPFVAHGAAPDFEPKQFACIMLNGKWKLHHFENNIWKRITTGLPDDATECSPCAEFDPSDGKWKLSLIAGGFDGGREFYLYKIDDLYNPKPEKIQIADVGFIWKNKIVHGLRNGILNICGDLHSLTLKFPNVEYLYRVSYNANSPYELLISGQYKDSGLFSWICNPYTKTLREVSVNGEPAYKMALFNGQCFYAKRNSEAYEDRSIAEAETLTEEILDYDSNVVEILGVESPSTFQMAKNLAVSAVNWVKSGFAVVSDVEYERRIGICNACEFWDSTAYVGFGKCLKCGCTSAKHHLASEKCPIEKW